MAITSIDRDYGVSPSIVRITTTDNYSTVTTTGYLKAQMPTIFSINGGNFNFVSSDLVCCYYNNGHAFFNLSADFSTLTNITPATSSIVGTANEITATTVGDTVTLSFPSAVIFPNDITVNSVNVGQGLFSDGSNLSFGTNALGGNVSGSNNTGIGSYVLGILSSGGANLAIGPYSQSSNNGNNNVTIGFYSASNLGSDADGSNNTMIGTFTGNAGGNSSGVNMFAGDNNTFLGYFVTGNDTAISGAIGLGAYATPNAATGSTSGTFGPSIAIGSSTYPVGFRGDGSPIPAGSQNYWRVKVNDTFYRIPLITDGAAIFWPVGGTLATTSQLPSSGTPLAAASGGTGVNNSFNLTITAASTINQNVSTSATPTFASIITAPSVSAASTLALGTAYRNTLGYDVVLIVYIDVATATAGSILSGVGSTNTPTQQTIISSITTATDVFIPVTVYLPNNYYALISTSGTITASISGQQITPV